MKHLLITFFFILQVCYSFATEVYTIDTVLEEINLKAFCYHYEDTTDTLTVDELSNVNWNKLPGGPNFGATTHIQWVRFDLSNSSNQDIERVVFIPFHHIHEIDVFSVVGDSIEKICETGAKRPFDKKHIKSFGYPIKIKLAANRTTSVILRFRHLYRPLRATTYLMTLDRVQEVIYGNNTLVSFWRGVFLFALVISLILYWFIRLKVFLYYFFLNLGALLFMGSQMGDYFLFFNVDKSDVNTVFDFSGEILVNLFFPLFLSALTPVKERNKTLWKWMYRFIYVLFIFYFLNLFPILRESKIMLYSHYYFMILTGIVFLVQPILLFKSLMHKDKNAIPLFAIYSFYVLSVFVNVIFPNMGIFEDSPYVHNGLMAGSLIEIFSFMFLMGREALNVFKERSMLLMKEKGHQKEMIVSIVKGQEEERNRVGRELHDLIGANMAIIKQKVDKGNSELYKIVDSTIDSVRTLSHGLVTPMVKDDEFMDELKEMCHLFSSEEIEVNIFFYKWTKIDNPEITTHLYRITQELLQNAVKHSQAKTVFIQLIGGDDQKLSLNYEDDGIGFNYAHQIGKGLGLKNIENRVSILNGTLQVDSSEKGKGTIIFIDVLMGTDITLQGD